MSCDIGQHVIVCGGGYYLTGRDERWLKRRFAVFAVIEFLRWCNEPGADGPREPHAMGRKSRGLKGL